MKTERYRAYGQLALATAIMGFCTLGAAFIAGTGGDANVTAVLILVSWGMTFFFITLYARVCQKLIRLGSKEGGA